LALVLEVAIEVAVAVEVDVFSAALLYSVDFLRYRAI
jgi:hypothetical protein